MFAVDENIEYEKQLNPLGQPCGGTKDRLVMTTRNHLSSHSVAYLPPLRRWQTVYDKVFRLVARLRRLLSLLRITEVQTAQVNVND